MIEALFTVMAHVGLLALLVHPLLGGRDVGHGLPGLRRREHRVL